MGKFHYTERDLFLLKQPQINDSLPMNLRREYEIGRIVMFCTNCHTQFQDELITGVVTTSFPDVVTIEGIAVCDSCKSAARINSRLYKDGRKACLTKNGWVELKRITLIARLKIKAIGIVKRFFNH